LVKRDVIAAERVARVGGAILPGAHEEEKRNRDEVNRCRQVWRGRVGGGELGEVTQDREGDRLCSRGRRVGLVVAVQEALKLDV
jgi:hypothetical protein